MVLEMQGQLGEACRGRQRMRGQGEAGKTCCGSPAPANVRPLSSIPSRAAVNSSRAGGPHAA